MSDNFKDLEAALDDSIARGKAPALPESETTQSRRALFNKFQEFNDADYNRLKDYTPATVGVLKEKITALTNLTPSEADALVRYVPRRDVQFILNTYSRSSGEVEKVNLLHGFSTDQGKVALKHLLKRYKTAENEALKAEIKSIYNKIVGLFKGKGKEKVSKALGGE